MIVKELEKVKRQREKGSLKTRLKKLKFSGKHKSHTTEALTLLIRTHHVATIRVASPLRFKCGTKTQEPCMGRKLFIF